MRLELTISANHSGSSECVENCSAAGATLGGGKHRPPAHRRDSLVTVSGGSSEHMIWCVACARRSNATLGTSYTPCYRGAYATPKPSLAALPCPALPCPAPADKFPKPRKHNSPITSATMGKRKKAAKKPTGPRRNEPLATVFPCLFCNHEKSVTVKLEKKSGIGQLSCKVCDQSFQSQINYLSAAVDVYSDWVDACDAVASKQSELRADGEADRPQARPSAGRGGARRAESDDVDDGANYVADDFVEVDDAGDDDDY